MPIWPSAAIISSSRIASLYNGPSFNFSSAFTAFFMDSMSPPASFIISAKFAVVDFLASSILMLFAVVMLLPPRIFNLPCIQDGAWLKAFCIDSSVVNWSKPMEDAKLLVSVSRAFSCILGIRSAYCSANFGLPAVTKASPSFFCPSGVFMSTPTILPTIFSVKSSSVSVVCKAF